MARLQDHLDSALNAHLLAQQHPNERLKLVHRLHHRFTDIKPEGDTAIKLAGGPATLAEAEPPPPATPDLPLIPRVNVRYRHHAKHLSSKHQEAHLIHDTSTSSLTDRRELLIKVQALPG